MASKELPLESTVLMNTRVLCGPFSGVQRYIRSMLRELGDRVGTVCPSKPLKGLSGQCWEQVVLPTKLRGSLLWSPNHTGPLAVSNQVVTVHDLAPFDCLGLASNTRYATWFRWLLPNLLPRVRRVVTVSEFSKERIVEICRVNPGNVAVAYNGIDSSYFPRTVEEVQTALRRIGAPINRYILTVGALDPRKNVGILLRAWSRVLNRIPEDVWLFVVGERRRMMSDDLLLHFDIPDRVFFAGHVAEEVLPAIYSGAEIFVFPSLYEGFGLPPLEAMACGTAVLAGNNSALPEVLGSCAELIDMANEEELAHTLLTLLEDGQKQASLAKSGLTRASGYTWGRSAREVWQALADI